ncbi:MAG: hypothetical protein GF344_17090 [Chitinivibrionales bacterium]|nr:hypothetical protein [Chitinivibrionales bacterium]MBD3358398.1 hypothetical protein [Chitinivibrionales bacterium]
MSATLLRAFPSLWIGTMMCVAVTVFIPGCSAPPHVDREAETVDTDTTPDTSRAKANAVPDEEVSGRRNDRPVLLEPSQWRGKRFVMVEKVRMFRKFGYLLYTSPQLDSATSAPNPAVALKNHRLKYDVFAGGVVTVTAVEEQDDGEYLATFQTDTMGLTVYGKTRNGIIEGIHAEEDLVAARDRWLGQTVFSRRRLIDTYDSAASRFATTPVSITEPLEVVAVRWGMTPLPPKPIWLVVQRADGSRGIIPVNYSWTNVPPQKRTDGLPWSMDILEEDPRSYGWEDEIWEAIDETKLLTGMTTKQVRLSWGEPANTHSRIDERGRRVRELTYPGDILFFVNDSLANVRKRHDTPTH